ncbi:Abi family protein [Lacticaseibacillus saniviri]|uniref:Abi family protein n=1 Tax=Lacticaseibacillus saniviri TaxID=931533 RepID=UPI000705346E|nr:Abi family protein [Lacticaseibacillus saniviri]
MTTDKPFQTIDSQIKILSEERHLNFLNKEAAADTLRRYGYYEIINGYKDNFLVDPHDDSKGYLATANFEHIFALFTLDKNIRQDVMQALGEFETTFTQALAYAIADKISEDFTRYTAPSHYNAGASHWSRGHRYTVRDGVIKTFNKVNRSTIDPFEFYNRRHGNIPPWIMVKGLTFGNVLYWYQICKPEVRLQVISSMFGLDEDVVNVLDPELKLKQAFGDVLDLFLTYRNLAAHGDRIYNHRSRRHRLRWSPFIYRKNVIDISRNKFSQGHMRSSLGAVIACLSLFENKDPYSDLWIMLGIHIGNYLRSFPEDESFIMSSAEFQNKQMYELIEKQKNSK